MIPILVLNLPCAKDRKEHMINILSEQGLIEETHYTILKGVDGRDISQDEVDRINKTRMKYYKEKTRPMTRGQIGCIKSHLLAYKTMVEKGYEECMILEDDTSFVNSFSDIMMLMSVFPERDSYDYLLLHREVSNMCLKAKNWSIVKNWFKSPYIDKPTKNPHFLTPGLCMGTNAQIVSLRGAKKLLEWFKTIYDPMDIQIHMMNGHCSVFDSNRYKPLRSYALSEVAMKPAGFPSSTMTIR